MLTAVSHEALGRGVQQPHGDRTPHVGCIGGGVQETLWAGCLVKRSGVFLRSGAHPRQR